MKSRRFMSALKLRRPYRSGFPKPAERVKKRLPHSLTPRATDSGEAEVLGQSYNCPKKVDYIVGR